MRLNVINKRIILKVVIILFLHCQDDFMCAEDEDYGLVNQMQLYCLLHMFLSYVHFKIILQEYSEDSNSEPDVDLENQYYNSKALKEDEPKAALISFQKVLDLEAQGGEKGEWGFKALKQMIKILFTMVIEQFKNLSDV